jgi:hypothetical protein
VKIPVMAASWRPLSGWLENLRRSPRSALVALNVLNVLDALLTSFAVHREGAMEVNAFVRLIGLPGKLALVGLLSIFLFRVRPLASCRGSCSPFRPSSSGTSQGPSPVLASPPLLSRPPGRGACRRRCRRSARLRARPCGR